MKTLLSTCFVLGFALAACSWDSSKPVVTVEQSYSTTYYSVTGTDADSIYASIVANGPTDRSSATAPDAVGLTNTESNYAGKYDGHANCHLTQATIKLRIIVTLPRLATPDAPADIVAKWDSFATSVAVHEQHHVDIAIAGAQETKALMEAMPGNGDGCDALEQDVKDLWARQDAKTAAAQAAFHTSEDERLPPQRKPLQDRIDRDKVRLDQLKGETAADEKQLATLEAEMKTLQNSLAAMDREYPSHEAPEPAYSRYNSMVATYNSDLVTYNRLVAQHNAAVQESNTIVDDLNAAQDALTWIN